MTLLLAANAAVIGVLFGLFSGLVIESLGKHQHKGLVAGAGATLLLLALCVGNIVAAIEVNR